MAYLQEDWSWGANNNGGYMRMEHLHFQVRALLWLFGHVLMITSLHLRYTTVLFMHCSQDIDVDHLKPGPGDWPDKVSPP